MQLGCACRNFFRSPAISCRKWEPDGKTNLSPLGNKTSGFTGLGVCLVMLSFLLHRSSHMDFSDVHIVHSQSFPFSLYFPESMAWKRGKEPYVSPPLHIYIIEEKEKSNGGDRSHRSIVHLFPTLLNHASPALPRTKLKSYFISKAHVLHQSTEN